jgi:hypothetical protein
MTDVTVEIDKELVSAGSAEPTLREEKLNFDEPPTPKATDAEKRDAWSLLSDIDPVSGLPYAWLDVREALMKDGPAQALGQIYDYYQERNPSMDSWMNYLLACSHFTKEELGDPVGKGARRRLELRIKKAMKKNKGPVQNYRQFYYENKDALLNDD